jgi:hypothetical protein
LNQTKTKLSKPKPSLPNFLSFFQNVILFVSYAITSLKSLNYNLFVSNLYNKCVQRTKNEPQQGISYLERAREGAGVREREGWVAGQQAVIFKMRLGLGETERRRHRNKET